MAQEPSGDARGFSPRPGPWQSDLSNGSVSPAEAKAPGNITQTPLGDAKSSFNYMIIVVAVVLLIGLFGLVGNGTVIWLLGFRVKRNPFSVYILNLAIADFLFLLSIAVVVLLFINNTRDLTILILPVLSTSYLAGLTLLMAISTERCISALFPIWYRCHRPAHLSAIVCAVLWGLSLCLGVVFSVGIYYHLVLFLIVILVYNVTSFLTLLVLCVSSLTLLFRVHCGSWRRQTTKLHRVILLTVLAFLLLGLPLNVGLFINLFFPSLFSFLRYEPIFYIPSVLNSTVNPVIYFFVGRQGQLPGRKALRDVLQSALTEDT
ncbi:mas-related G-protein coupled receptor member X1-like [Molossus molossus]|uniref:mas-related G-protein coupled receptor member X1-like n=1 Tax=Molossus molossus TaxID=27622 RepID=UPI001746B7D8|nr:mas-related G-protein coupled receptor member X1-like [Molossus molossus]